MIRELAQKVDALFKGKHIFPGPSLESALFEGWSDDGYWDARHLLDMLLEDLAYLRMYYGGEYGQSDEKLMTSMNLRIRLSPQELDTVREIREILRISE